MGYLSLEAAQAWKRLGGPQDKFPHIYSMWTGEPTSDWSSVAAPDDVTALDWLEKERTPFQRRWEWLRSPRGSVRYGAWPYDGKAYVYSNTPSELIIAIEAYERDRPVVTVSEGPSETDWSEPA